MHYAKMASMSAKSPGLWVKGYQRYARLPLAIFMLIRPLLKHTVSRKPVDTKWIFLLRCIIFCKMSMWRCYHKSWSDWNAWICKRGRWWWSSMICKTSLSREFKMVLFVRTQYLVQLGGHCMILMTSLNHLRFNLFHVH